MTEVWENGQFLGKVAILPEDWRNATNWRQAALSAARRHFGAGIYHVAEKSHMMGEVL